MKLLTHTGINHIICAVALLLLPQYVLCHEPVVPSSIEHYQLERLNHRILIVHGPQALPNVITRGFMNNPAAILTNKGIIVIDPGSSVEIGKQFLEKLHKQTNKPVIAVFNTHVHGDHWLGNQAIRQAFPDVPIYAHKRMIERAEQGEGDNWIGLLNNMTEGATEGTRAVAPTIGLNGDEILDIDGVKLRIYHFGKSHTDHDILIEVIDAESLFLGDVVANKRVPSSDVPRDAYYKGQLNAIQQIVKLPVKTFIPGHGKSGGKEIPEASLKFLERLYKKVSEYYEQGLSDYEMKEKVVNDMSAYKDWHNFNELGRVISHMYLQIEEESF